MAHKLPGLCLLVALVFSGCDSQPDPAADARRAVAAGDRRLVGYMGVGLVVPGTPAGFQPETYGPGVRVLPDITDTSPPAESEKADAYASRYNKVVLGCAASTSPTVIPP